jgi:tetratricopeptide (TPR) repeat protein
LLLLVLFEAVLRIAHYGADLSILRTVSFSGRTYYNMNPQVKGRYFSRVEFNPATSMDYFEIPKPAETFRIVCLGGSTTAGYPYGYAGSFPTCLQQRLRYLFPEKAVEVINFGITATNSFTVRDLALDMDEMEPDLLIVYDGHNEFYGALGVASREVVAPARWVTLLYLKLIRWKIVQLSRDMFNAFGGSLAEEDSTGTSGTMMERLARGRSIPYGSDMYEAALDTYLANVADVARYWRERRVPVIFSSQVSNLRDLRPFVPGGSEALSPDMHEAVKYWYDRGILAFDQGKPDSALAAFLRGLTRDSLRADIQYDLGRCYVALGHMDKALRAFELARDYDQLRFRMSGEFNRALGETAGREGALFADMEGAFRSSSPDSIIGKELILEHLHPNDTGYFLMAKTFAAVMRRHNILADSTDWGIRDTVSDMTIRAATPLTVLDLTAAQRRTEILISGWPFRDGSVRVPTPPSDPLGAIIDQLLRGEKSWEYAHVAAATYFESAGELPLAEKEYRALIAMLPFNVSAYLKLGQLYVRSRRYEDARPVLLRSLEVEPTAYAYSILASLALDTGKPEDAIALAGHAIDLCRTTKERTGNMVLLALAFRGTGDRLRAVSTLREVLQFDPGNTQARGILEQMGGVR